jgi:hypothetical protein
MFVKLAAVGKVMPGRLGEPVASRRVHAANRSSVPRPHLQNRRDRVRMWIALSRWGRIVLSETHRDLVLHRFLNFAQRPCRELTVLSHIGPRLPSSLQMHDCQDTSKCWIGVTA